MTDPWFAPEIPRWLAFCRCCRCCPSRQNKAGSNLALRRYGSWQSSRLRVGCRRYCGLIT